MAEVYPDDANGRVLRGMAASGTDMSVRYAIDFEHAFPDLQAAEAFEHAAIGPGRRIEKSEYDGQSGFYWQVRVVVRMIPTHAAITRTEQELGELADACGGVKDGWGVLA